MLIQARLRSCHQTSRALSTLKGGTPNREANDLPPVIGPGLPVFVLGCPGETLEEALDNGKDAFRCWMKAHIEDQSLVGAYLKEVLRCDFVDYNVRPPGGGLESLGELDVVGLRFSDRMAYLCEVTTHLDGLQYGTYATTVKRLLDKYKRQQAYAQEHLTHFKKAEFMFWSPVVRVGALTKALSEIDGLQIIINSAYTDWVRELEAQAKRTTRDAGNPCYRVLQLLAHLRTKGGAGTAVQHRRAADGSQ